MFPETASSTVVDRTSRVRAAAGWIALAYLRLLAEGDTLRASVVLAVFQGFWNVQRRNITAGAVDLPAMVPPDLVASGQLNQPTQNALLYTLWLNQLVLGARVDAVQGYGATVLLQQIYPHLRVSLTNVWLVYNEARAVPVGDVHSAIEDWAFSFVEGISQEDDLYNTLAQGGATVDSTGIGPEIPITGMSTRGTTYSYWPWALGGLALVLAGAGFAYRMKRRRRRR